MQHWYNEIVNWNDNAVATFGSNTYRIEPIKTVKRWVKGKCEVYQSLFVAQYNHGMRDGDLFNKIYDP